MSLNLKKSPEQIISDAIREMYPMITFRVSEEPASFRTKLSATIDAPDRSNRWGVDTYVDHSFLFASGTPEFVLVQTALEMCEQLINSVPIEKIGAYPFARIWLDIHNQNKNESRFGTWLWSPKKDVPGWVFSKAYKSYPKDKSAKQVPEVVKDFGKRPPEVTAATDNQALRKAVKMAATKKRVVRRAENPAFDPTKVKAPKCNVHQSPMAFDMKEEKWRCTEHGCKVVARPKRDEDDRNVILGKGGLQLRLVCQDGGRSVVLISDDNVALDITKLVDVDEIMEDFDVMVQADVASKAGKEVFTIPVEKPIVFSIPMVVMGASDLA